MVQRLFVYGTLKQGKYFHDEYLAGQSEFRGPARTTTDYTLYYDGMPHMVKERGEHGVEGELYEIDMDTLARIDELEGHPVVYKREIIEVIDATGNQTLAYAYLRNKNFSGKIYCWVERFYE